jgi:endoglucanase
MNLKTLILLLMMVIPGFGDVVDQVTFNKPNEDFALKRGTNISHWLSQSQRRGEERRVFFTESDVKFLADLGFDHIRIPIDEEQMWDMDGNKEKEAFSLLHQAMGWCEKYGLKVVVDLHILRSHHFNQGDKALWTDAKEQERFYQCWRELSAELKKYPVSLVAYELMNEPVADDPEDWNKLVANATQAIRENEPERKIVIGSNMWQSADTFDDLKVPENDPHVILSFHMYEPMLVTHYKASWTSIREYEGPVDYPGQIVKDEDWRDLSEPLKSLMERQKRFYDKATIEKHFEKPIRLARQLNLPLYCGEWGAFPTTPDEARYQWYKDVKEVLEANGIAWSTWDYKGGFGIIRGGEKDERLINILLEE